MAAASLVGQALGRGDPSDARRWGWDVAKVSALFVGSISLMGLFFPDLLLRLFLHDSVTLALARLPLRIVAAAMAFDTVGIVLMNALLGAGDNRRVMVLAVSCQWLLFLPAAYLIGPVAGLGLSGVWLAQVAYRSLLTVGFVQLWRGGGWAGIQV